MNRQIQIAQNNGRYYRISLHRYFPIARAEALRLLASGEGREVPYLPFSRPDLYEAYKVAKQAIDKAASIKQEDR